MTSAKIMAFPQRAPQADGAVAPVAMILFGIREPATGIRVAPFFDGLALPRQGHQFTAHVISHVGPRA